MRRRQSKASDDMKNHANNNSTGKEEKPPPKAGGYTSQEWEGLKLRFAREQAAREVPIAIPENPFHPVGHWDRMGIFEHIFVF